MNTLTAIPQLEEMTYEEMETVAGGHPFEECFGDTALYRADVFYQNVIFGSDRYFIGSKQISKDLAKTLRAKSDKLWKSKYEAQAGLVGYLREWKENLDDQYDIVWDGTPGVSK